MTLKWKLALGATLAAISLIGAGGLAGRAHAQELSSDKAQWPADIDQESSGRLPVPKRSDLSPADQKIWDEIEGELQSGGLPALEKDRPLARMYSPGVAKGLGDAHRYLKYDAGIDDRLMNIAVLTTTRELDAQFEWTQWELHARDPKDPRYLEPHVLDVIKTCKPVTDLSEQDAAVITLGRELFGPRKVSSKTFAKVLKLFGPRKTVDIEELMALYAQTTEEQIMFNQQLHPGQKPLLPAHATPCGVSASANLSWLPDLLR